MNSLSTWSKLFLGVPESSKQSIVSQSTNIVSLGIRLIRILLSPEIIVTVPWPTENDPEKIGLAVVEVGLLITIPLYKTICSSPDLSQRCGIQLNSRLVVPAMNLSGLKLIGPEYTPILYSSGL